jgi:Mycobacterial 4 TMS phage holin, superfamily IV
VIRLLVRTLIFLGSAALGLVVAAQLLDDVEVTASGFITVVLIYAVIQSIISPFLARFAAKNATAFLGGVGLVATFVALVAATALGDSLTITGGVVTWISATVIVWLVTALATLLLPFALLKAGVESARERRPG